jgi:hypothetical protein
MKTKLLTVSDTFEIGRAGLVVAPAPLVRDFRGPKAIMAELKRPDGSVLAATMQVEYMFPIPPPKERRWSCIFRGLAKADIPAGTEIWVESIEAEAGSR